MYKLFTYTADANGPCAASPSPRETATDVARTPGFATANPLPKIQNTGLSQKSLVARYMALDPIADCAFQERAAILEHDAGMSREDAEREALIQVMARYRGE